MIIQIFTLKRIYRFHLRIFVIWMINQFFKEFLVPFKKCKKAQMFTCDWLSFIPKDTLYLRKPRLICYSCRFMNIYALGNFEELGKAVICVPEYFWVFSLCTDWYMSPWRLAEIDLCVYNECFVSHGRQMLEGWEPLVEMMKFLKCYHYIL